MTGSAVEQEKIRMLRKREKQKNESHWIMEYIIDIEIYNSVSENNFF